MKPLVSSEQRALIALENIARALQSIALSLDPAAQEQRKLNREQYPFLNSPGMTIAEAARALKVDVRTVTGHCRKLGIKGGYIEQREGFMLQDSILRTRVAQASNLKRFATKKKGRSKKF